MLPYKDFHLRSNSFSGRHHFFQKYDFPYLVLVDWCICMLSKYNKSLQFCSPAPSLQPLVCETVLCRNQGLSMGHKTRYIYVVHNVYSHRTELSSINQSHSIPWRVHRGPLQGLWWNLDQRVWAGPALWFPGRKELWPGRATPSRTGLVIGQRKGVLMNIH